MSKKIFLIFCFSLFLFLPGNVSAESTYVLPYPSYMPGNILYKPRLIVSKISKYIYFGDFGKFDYNLKESDHYLVEAKTLFDYKQYLLATKALKKSDEYFMEIYPNLENAQRNGKDISEREELLREASRRHMDLLGGLAGQLPEEVNWSPEKSPSTNLNLKGLIDDSINIRNSVL